MPRRSKAAEQQEAHLTQVERYPDLKPLDPKNLTAKGFELDGTPSVGTTYKDLIALIMREDPVTFEAKMQAIQRGDYSTIQYTKEMVIRHAIARARMGDQTALNWLSEREEGKVTQSFSFEGRDMTQQQLRDIRQAVQLGAPTEEIKNVTPQS